MSLNLLQQLPFLNLSTDSYIRLLHLLQLYCFAITDTGLDQQPLPNPTTPEELLSIMIELRQCCYAARKLVVWIEGELSGLTGPGKLRQLRLLQFAQPIYQAYYALSDAFARLRAKVNRDLARDAMEERVV